MKIEPRVLENPFVRLEPIGEPHREGLRAACNADQDVWTRLYPYSWAGEHFDPTWAKLIDRGRFLAGPERTCWPWPRRSSPGPA